MQERHIAGEAGQSASSWYLSRGNKQYGPLGDRELLLLAERGGLKKDDLLWKPGFDKWQPVRSVCDLEAKPTVAAAKPAAVQGADEVTTTTRISETHLDETPASEAEPSRPSLRTRFGEELRKFLVFFAYLWLVFFVMYLHEWSVLASNQISFTFYGLAVVNALILAKIMLIAEAFGFATRLDDRPLIYPIMFKAVAFTVLLMLAYLAEEIAVGLFHGKSVAESIPAIGGGGVVGPLSIGIIMFIALLPFFAFREIARAVGPAEFRALMLGAKEVEDDPSVPIDAAAEPA
jgi:GYF domain 2